MWDRREHVEKVLSPSKCSLILNLQVAWLEPLLIEILETQNQLSSYPSVMGWTVSPEIQIFKFPVSQNLTSFASRIRVGLNPIQLVSLIKMGHRLTHTGKMPCGHEGSRHWGVASTSQGMPKVTSKLPDVRGEVQNRFSLTPLRRNQPCPHLDLRFPASRTVRQHTSVVGATRLLHFNTGGPSELVHHPSSHVILWPQ